MYEIYISLSFGAAHRLRDYQGKCENLHGHNWKIEVRVGAAALDKLGMVMDFHELKALTRQVIEELDHHYLNEDVAYFKKVNPSSENLAYYIFNELKPLIPSGRELVSVTVYESDNASATYSSGLTKKPKR